MKAVFGGEAMLQGLHRLADLVPEDYADYRPLVADGLLYFLSRLAPARQAAILAAQAALPARASLPRRLIALFRQCPTLHKLGQVVARDRRLSTELRARLQSLESTGPGKVLEPVVTTLRHELGDIGGLTVEQDALAEASVAIVIPFVWRTGANCERGVFKVLKPGVAARLEEELEIWRGLGAFLEERCTVHRLPVFDYRSTLDSVARLLANEICFDREQANLQAMRHFHLDSPDILVPRLFPFSTSRVTAMERVDGDKVTTPNQGDDQMRQRAERLARSLLAQPFWSRDGGVFHADPHAGNLLATPDGRLAILDWALITTLSRAQREAIVQIVLGGLTLNVGQIRLALDELGEPQQHAAIADAVAEAIRQVRNGVFPGFHWLTSLLDRLATVGALRFSEELVLFRKAVLTLTGVIADVSEDVSLDDTLVRQGVRHFMLGLPWRPWALIGSRDLGAHLSNFDLFRLWLDLPASVWRRFSAV